HLAGLALRRGGGEAPDGRTGGHERQKDEIERELEFEAAQNGPLSIQALVPTCRCLVRVMPSASGVGNMIAITRGVAVTVLLAGAVAGTTAFPRFFAGPGGGETPSFVLPGAAAQPAIVR